MTQLAIFFAALIAPANSNLDQLPQIDTRPINQIAIVDNLKDVREEQVQAVFKVDAYKQLLREPLFQNIQVRDA